MDATSGLPSAKPLQLGTNIVLQPPLSRCGRGPGLILLRPASYAKYKQENTSLDPEPLQKWAEESFAVAQITLDGGVSQDSAAMQGLVQEACQGLTDLLECTQDQFGLLGIARRNPLSPLQADWLIFLLSLWIQDGLHKSIRGRLK